MLSRRAVLSGLIAAPLVARADALMKIRGIVMPAISMRALTWYKIALDEFVTRFDVVFDSEIGRPARMELFNTPPLLQQYLLRSNAELLQEAKRMALAEPRKQFGFTVPVPQEMIINFDADGKLLFGNDRLGA